VPGLLCSAIDVTAIRSALTIQTPSALDPSGLYTRFRMSVLRVAPRISDLSKQSVRNVLAFVAAWQSTDVATVLRFTHVSFGFCTALQWRQLCLIFLKCGLDLHNLRYLPQQQI
jgi:hypothetical protein